MTTNENHTESAAIGSELKYSDTNYVNGIFDDHGDPHQAALIDTPNQRLPLTVWLSVFFLGFSFLPAIGFMQLGPGSVIVFISLDLQGSTNNMTWIVNSWAITASASYAIGGYLSDIYGRKHIIMTGQVGLDTILFVALIHQTGSLSNWPDNCSFSTKCESSNCWRFDRRIWNRSHICGLCWYQ